MTHDQLENALVEAIAEEVIRRINEKLIQMQKNALVVCTGSRLSLPAWIESLKKLQQQGFRFDLFLSKSAERVLGPDEIQKNLQIGQIWIDDNNAEAIAGEYQTVLVPALTINTAAKLAACTADTPAARVILTSMMRGKAVVVSTDGCCPDNVARLDLGYRFTPAMKEKLRANIERMRSFGATLATADTLAERTVKALGLADTGQQRKVQQPEPAQVACNSRVISRQAVAAVPQGGVLRIPKGSMVTQLAEDTARTRGIALIKE